MRAIIRPSLLTTAIAILLSSTGIVLASGEHSPGNAAKGPIAEYRELTPEETTIQTILDTYAKAMETKSPETMEDAIIADDFSTIESGHPNWTWPDFRDNHMAVEIETFTDIDYDIDLIVGEFNGDLGFSIFEYTASGKADGTPMSVSGYGTAILEKTDDGWRMHHMHTSMTRPQHGSN